MSDSDVTEPIWEVVAELEREYYTKREIAAALHDVAADVDPDDDGTMGTDTDD